MRMLDKLTWDILQWGRKGNKRARSKEIRRLMRLPYAARLKAWESLKKG
jgi:hypothetical protein